MTDTKKWGTSGLEPQNQATLEQYYNHTNVGDFLGAVQLLSEDVVYRMPGVKPLVPYAGDWTGRDEVVKLFDTFLSSFWMVHMSETLVLVAPNELLAFNDEAFKARSTGRFFRTAVVHHMQFGDDHLIRALDTYFDTVPPEQAFGDQAVSMQPMLAPPLPPDSDTADEAAVRDLVTRFCDAGLEPAARRALLAEDAVLSAPGSPDRTPFSGVWIGDDQIVEFFERYNAALANRHQILRSVIVNGNWAGVVTTESGRRNDGNSIEIRKAELYRISSDKIVQAYLYVDTPRLTAVSSVAENVEAVHLLYDELWSKQRYELIEKLIAPDHVFHMPDGAQVVGREAYTELMKSFAMAFPDMSIELKDLWGAGDKITNRLIFHGSQTGPLAGLGSAPIPASGKTVAMSGQHIARFVNGMFAETWANFDTFTLLRQMGVLPTVTD
jgi:predicted ester cyclase/ketosteroid isomerase-like protein